MLAVFSKIKLMSVSFFQLKESFLVVIQELKQLLCNLDIFLLNLIRDITSHIFHLLNNCIELTPVSVIIPIVNCRSSIFSLIYKIRPVIIAHFILKSLIYSLFSLHIIFTFRVTKVKLLELVQVHNTELIWLFHQKLFNIVHQ